ncbi:MAG TPA: hypothetical protein VH394_18285 [Thermoanaerobaculia bacterium]|jgi:hypothetical protein|nr:hypothetical protein [Thermoanaerobaculia bacterium]
MSPTKILSRSALTLLTILALLPAPVAAGSGVTVKQDGDSIVLIPDDPGKTYLIVGYPRDADPKGSSTGQLSTLSGERRLPAKQFTKLVVMEIHPVSEVILTPGQAGWQLTANPCQAGTCNKPFPICPPNCPFLYLINPATQDLPMPPK